MSRTMHEERKPSPKSVLAYLAELMNFCRAIHRQDLASDYYEAWKFYADRIYGPLPPRKTNASVYMHWGYPTETQTGGKQETPGWKLAMLSKPWRKVIARDGEWEILECRHRFFHVSTPENPNPKRRRCGDCAENLSRGQADSESALGTRKPKPPAAAHETVRSAGKKSKAVSA